VHIEVSLVSCFDRVCRWVLVVLHDLLISFRIPLDV
jgi:hypothetical protein